MVFFTKS